MQHGERASNAFRWAVTAANANGTRPPQLGVHINVEHLFTLTPSRRLYGNAAENAQPRQTLLRFAKLVRVKHGAFTQTQEFKFPP